MVINKPFIFLKYQIQSQNCVPRYLKYTDIHFFELMTITQNCDARHPRWKHQHAMHTSLVVNKYFYFLFT